MSNDFHQGQRWVSESEPELGLGTVGRVTDRTITVVFAASDQSREYSRRNAPLQRVHFLPGDHIRSSDNVRMTVRSVTERDGLLYYRDERHEICETALSDTISFDKPEHRLLAGQLDPPEVFDLRLAALEQQHRRRKSEVRGFLGGRIDLIPHQLYIAAEVAGRLVPRVLLADEVGLGKTIEACLILHRLILTGRAQRILILVPESLVHQWFVELLRRFNLWFHIFDEERCRSIESLDPAANPFLDDQFVLCGINLCIDNERRAEQALEAGWDMVVVDEAHHLGWSPESASPEYRLVEALGTQAAGLLLLTASPEQLGMASHFARLRLLDPNRFYDLQEFVREEEHYRDIARAADQLNNEEELNRLLDQHGTGRVRFRNTRATVSGFPARIPRMHPIPSAEAHKSGRPGHLEALYDWLAELLRGLNPDKVLVICRTQARVIAIEEAMRERLKNVRIALFHEGLTLVQRDRNAAWFAEDHGAPVLVCSEIGSEGRNFQFAHHLVLFDLPFDPELLEQRIGRLDRIGQTAAIEVHVPYVEGTGQEVLARWFHEGLQAFERNLQGGRELFERFGARVHELTQRLAPTKLERLLQETRTASVEVAARLHDGRDRLLELNSFRPAVAGRLAREIQAQDADGSLDEFMIRIFDHYAIQVEDIAPRTYKLGSAGVLTDAFPGLPADGFVVTCDRQRAVVREDIQFLTWDHPLVSGALDLLLGSERGNSSFAVWTDAKGTGLFIETVHVLECVAPPQLHADRFLPPTPFRTLIDHNGKAHQKCGALQNGDGQSLLKRPEFREELLPDLLEKTQEMAQTRADRTIATARKEMKAQLDREIERLTELRKVNRSVRQEEIDLLVAQRQTLDGLLAAARLRLDAIRLIQRCP